MPGLPMIEVRSQTLHLFKLLIGETETLDYNIVYWHADALT